MQISVSVEPSLIDRNRFIFFYLIRFIYILWHLIATSSLFVRSLFNFAFYLAFYSIVVLIFFLSFVFLFQENGCLYSHIRWGEAFVVVYSVTCKRSFQEARGLLKQLADLRLPSYFTALLLGNKRDLDHARWVLDPTIRVKISELKVTAAAEINSVF